ncbi:MAG TPA: HNH endonuclease signature motif containing protein [Clostridiales bacterium]|nr:HNH endonuclease signature motif containing protein [Clostridiales bacterium]HQP69143.1 HNH endonuclease signature motif containing protein [Clostridiales bacterium]
MARWGFSTRVSTSGYRQYNSGSGWNYTHRTVAENKVGGTIFSGYEVHHINGNKLDNRPSNLTILSSSDHHKIHSK